MNGLVHPEFHAPLPLANIPDFISTYREYADVFECPGEVHEVVAISLLAAVLNAQGVTIPHGAVKYPLDLWVLILSPSGMGRNNLLRPARKVLNEAGQGKLLLNPAWGSKQAMYQAMADRPRGLFVLPEMGAFLKMLSTPQFGEAKMWLTDRYDEWSVPDAVTYRVTGNPTDTPSIKFADAPRLNFLASSSDDWFTQHLDPEDTTGGFVPRWLIVKTKGAERLVPIPRPLNEHLLAQLSSRIEAASKLCGEADFGEVHELYIRWYEATFARFAAHPNSHLALPFFARLRGEVLKLALIYEVSQSASLSVSESAMQRAFAMLGQIEAMVFELLRTDLSHNGTLLVKMEDRIRGAGGVGLSRTEFCRLFQNTEQRERDGTVQRLADAATVRFFSRPTEGRPARYLVHREHVSAYRQAHPQDVEAPRWWR